MLEVVEAPRDAGAVSHFLPRLRRALDGDSPLLTLPPEGVERRRLVEVAAGTRVPGRVALVVPTSGSTGTPRLASLSAAALMASAEATHAFLGGSGRWLLSLPTTHIAGLQVLVRSLHAHLTPAVVDTSGGFTAEAFADAVRRLDVDASEHPHYTALVPTQLQRLLDDGAGVEALWQLDAVLLGGSAADAALLARAADAGVTVVRTYGMTETCGGCVYDGEPLPGVEIDIADDGLIRLRGPMLFDGYVGHGGQPAPDGWFTTSDLGQLEDGVLRVLGRSDNVIISGGEKCTAEVVERAILSVDGVQEVVVVGVPDAEWGERVVALVTRGGPLGDVRAAVQPDLPAGWAPREVHEVDAPARGRCPLLSPRSPQVPGSRRTTGPPTWCSRCWPSPSRWPSRSRSTTRTTTATVCAAPMSSASGRFGSPPLESQHPRR